MNKSPDTVTAEYIEAYRLGVLIRTPIQNIAFFKAEDKAVVAYTKNNGSFVLSTPLWLIKSTLKDTATQVHRAYVVLNSMLPGLKHWKKGTTWEMEVITSVKAGERLGLMPHTIPISRRETKKVRAALKEQQ